MKFWLRWSRLSIAYFAVKTKTETSWDSVTLVPHLIMMIIFPPLLSVACRRPFLVNFLDKIAHIKVIIEISKRLVDIEK